MIRQDGNWLSDMSSVVAIIVGCVGLLATLGSGCGEDDPCASKTCEFGVCQSSDGACVNEELCNVDADCIPGYICGEDASCVPQNECSESQPCDAGVCEEGACVNPDTCESNADCLDRTYCADDGTCKPDPCNDVNCERGVCQPGTDNCVSADSCTERTERIDCIAGEKCLDGSCTPREQFCDQLSCERGICSYEEDGCANAGDCAGDRTKCLEGNFCNGMGRCQADLCVQGDVDCEDDGVCVPATGECENAEICESSADCVENHVCVTEGGDATGTCRLESMACGDASGDGGCPGNQICDYDSETNVATCLEPDVCETSIDCTTTDSGAKRQCGGGQGDSTCLAPTSCRADAFESNDTADEATSFADQTTRGVLSATLCQGDTDVYTVSKSDFVEASVGGEMVVEVSIPRRDIGLGEASMRLVGPDDSEIATANLGSWGQDRTMRLTHPVQASDEGPYRIEVTTGEEMTQNGLTYDLAVSILEQSTVAACDGAQVLEPGQRTSGDLSLSNSDVLGSTCTSTNNSSNEDIYRLELDRPQDVTVRATPELSSGDVSISLRDRCTVAESETNCSSSVGAGEAETIETVLSEGTHFVIVQAPEDGSLGPYDLKVERNFFTACGPADRFCVDDATAGRCVRDGGRTETLSCSNGCNPSTGDCVAPQGDRCQGAQNIDDPGPVDGEMSSRSVTANVDLSQYDNAYEVPGGTCLGEEPSTGGEDAAFAVNIPAGTSVRVDAEFADDVDGSIYLSETCSNLLGTCQTGSQGSSKETLQYSNRSESMQTRYVVADSPDTVEPGAVELEFTFIDVICSAGTNRCTGNGGVETCNEYGTKWVQTDVCYSFDCEAGVCVRPDDCSGAVNLTSSASKPGGVDYMDRWDGYADDYAGSADSDACSVNSTFTSGEDVVWEVQMEDGEALRASLDTVASYTQVFKDPSLSLRSGSCGGLTGTQCLAGTTANDSPAEITYVSDAQQTLYLVGDNDGDDPPPANDPERYEANVTLYDSACSGRNVTCNGDGDVQLCESADAVPNKYECGGGGGCTDGSCDTKTSDFCYEAENITSALNSQNGWSKTIVWSDYTNSVEADLNCGGIDDYDNDGNDAFFEVDLKANETLTVTLDTKGSDVDATPYIVPSCFDITSSCLSGDDSTGNSTISYVAGDSPETVYVVADHDDAGNLNDFEFSGSISSSSGN